MNKEVLFAKTLEQLKKDAKARGNYVTKEQVEEAFKELELNGDQFQMIYDYLLKYNIGIDAPLPVEDYLSTEEKDYLSQYLEELESLPVLTEGQKDAYVRQAMAGDEYAQMQLIQAYLKDVPEIAALYAGQGVFLEDLIGEGNVALTMGVTMLGSLESPHEAAGMLGKMIMDSMEEYILENANLKQADEKMVKKINEVNEKAKELSQELHRKVTVEELVSETKFSKKTIQDCLRMCGYQMEYIE